jgi:hypothetical protein
LKANNKKGDIHMEKYLPIGTVVLLEQGTKEVMIYGRKQRDTATGLLYDYVGCLYPEGNISKEYTFLFNHNRVATVVFTGYNSEENIELTKTLLDGESET